MNIYINIIIVRLLVVNGIYLLKIVLWIWQKKRNMIHWLHSYVRKQQPIEMLYWWNNEWNSEILMHKRKSWEKNTAAYYLMVFCFYFENVLFFLRSINAVYEFEKIVHWYMFWLGFIKSFVVVYVTLNTKYICLITKMCWNFQMILQ